MSSTGREVLERSAVDPQFTWNAESIFPSIEAWEVEYKAILADLDTVRTLREKMATTPSALVDVLEGITTISQRLTKVFMYAYLFWAVDTTDQSAGERVGQVQSLTGQLEAAISFLEPGLLALGHDRLVTLMGEEPRLSIYKQYFENLVRKKPHVRSAEVEELLGLLNEPFSGTQNTFGMITDADFQFSPLVDPDGVELPVTQGTIDKHLSSGDRQVRQKAWENHLDTFLAYKNTLTSNLATSVRQNVFTMRARNHQSTLGMALFQDNIPADVFHNLIEVFSRNLPTWHRYWAVRRRALGLKTLHTYDIWAPLVSDPAVIPYEQSVDWICQALAPLGEEYVTAMRRGCLEERWVDVYPNQGKSAGAFSWGTQGTHPFIVMNYVDDVFSLGTLAHELGHSMHSYLTWETQPPVYAEYSLFAAEVASNFHQAMLRTYLLPQDLDRSILIGLIEEAMANFHRYFLVMPTLARFELQIHLRAERGQGITADSLIELLADLFAEAYGDEMQLDRERDGIRWATFGHLYEDYYVYQYATGISGANTLASRIHSGEEKAVGDYLSFLKAGSSMYPIDALKMAGVDLSQAEAVEAAFEVLAGLVDKLDELV